MKNKIIPSESAIFPKELPLDRKNLALFVLVKDAFEVYKQIVLPPTNIELHKEIRMHEFSRQT